MQARELVRRLMLAGLSARINATADPVYADIAWVGGWLGLAARPNTRRVAPEALRALGRSPTRRAVRQFAWRSAYLRTADGVLSYQADRLVPAWIESNVLATRPLPESGCILVSVHHYGQRLGFAKLHSMTPELGAMSLFDGFADDDPELRRIDRMLSPRSRVRARTRFRDQVFGGRTFRPGPQIRQALQLLDRGGSLVVLADYSYTKRGVIFGRQCPVADGPLWFAERSGKPIVPFVVKKSSKQWHLWCSDEIPPTETSLAKALEDCIRQEPAGWLGWPEWYAAGPSQPQS